MPAALHVRACDEAHFIGGAEARESYLSIERLIEAARKSGAECVHPGYGFLVPRMRSSPRPASNPASFSSGPPSQAIRTMGLRDRAKTLMEKARVPVVPGYHGDRQDAKFLKRRLMRSAIRC